MPNTRFWTFRQNNSGGRWTTGMPVNLIIEACDAGDADRRAQTLGVYFDGVEGGQDCHCCGDRWHRSYGSGDAEPDPLDLALGEWAGLYAGLEYNRVVRLSEEPA
jgi:hypothetical protein